MCMKKPASGKKGERKTNSSGENIELKPMTRRVRHESPAVPSRVSLPLRFPHITREANFVRDYTQHNAYVAVDDHGTKFFWFKGDLRQTFEAQSGDMWMEYDGEWHRMGRPEGTGFIVRINGRSHPVSGMPMQPVVIPSTVHPNATEAITR